MATSATENTLETTKDTALPSEASTEQMEATDFDMNDELLQSAFGDGEVHCSLQSRRQRKERDVHKMAYECCDTDVLNIDTDELKKIADLPQMRSVPFEDNLYPNNFMDDRCQRKSATIDALDLRSDLRWNMPKTLMKSRRRPLLMSMKIKTESLMPTNNDNDKLLLSGAEAIPKRTHMQVHEMKRDVKEKEQTCEDNKLFSPSAFPTGANDCPREISKPRLKRQDAFYQMPMPQPNYHDVLYAPIVKLDGTKDDSSVLLGDGFERQAVYLKSQRQQPSLFQDDKTETKDRIVPQKFSQSVHIPYVSSPYNCMQWGDSDLDDTGLMTDQEYVLDQGYRMPLLKKPRNDDRSYSADLYGHRISERPLTNQYISVRSLGHGSCSDEKLPKSDREMKAKGKFIEPQNDVDVDACVSFAKSETQNEAPCVSLQDEALTKGHEKRIVTEPDTVFQIVALKKTANLPSKEPFQAMMDDFRADMQSLVTSEVEKLEQQLMKKLMKKTEKEPKKNKKRRVYCKLCDCREHSVFNCEFRHPNSQKHGSKACFRCGEENHSVMDCPKGSPEPKGSGN
ncbi:unnamed protein product [Owenia fusiformis]|uniref:Uncharacterized protein n=1 Tax=Owenia fusiformis TaxID=6347 RepID=A0A8J1UWH8_OWEFU|nr:unnamed protein product [Owenia fusiformis]